MDGLRLTDPESAHVTLKLPDGVSPDRVGAVEDTVRSIVEAVDVGPFGASISGLGVFPSLDCIRAVWVGVDDGAAGLTRSHEVTERETTVLGFNPEGHEFTPHVTLARMNDVRERVLVWRVIGGELPTIGSFRAREVRLRKSDLGPDGPEYGTVAQVSL